MDFLPDTDQDSLVQATRHYIDSHIPLSENITRLDDVRWKEIAELGWLGLATEEEAGGAGAALLDEVFVFREIGRALVPGPILTTLAAARLAAWAERTALARAMIGGQTRVARALPLSGADGRLLLLDTEECEYVLVVGDDRAALYSGPSHTQTNPGLEDGTSVGHVTLADLGHAVLAVDDGLTVGRLQRVLSILTSAQLAGICGATRDLASEYAKGRTQFGKPIGAFQAIKHKCADMATSALAADNVTFFAALTNDTDGTAARYHALAAAACCRRAAFANARSNIQIHGAMGFTVEDHAHRFLKRTHTLCTTESFDRAAQLLGGLPSAQTSEEA
ncbi:acyl-CoA dehydrogenase family protein [[Mycobacterium] vasticus]|uniref:Acyl-CoA dehydrogenase family protein n=1 Tax=[Mycobacterium] vasticus TaxID=2875777 RepID=A0ABU5Z258_9MYCO|nr:acyl-CoA dehydrogenase family protein [Mycolicibacter sp. MYC017]MEB3071492.1 acyl-CoA dehydrogenase family protein [Mycolicibacter sp. MYC017]